ncbi:uncharacterized protein H6S33_013175 [Morchella sextelata]|uniref:uncharacterized protein n=1 Tax=Morchella sextelata TaxID=1174677 RepID=UPI001D05C1FC|nr:uncharacterized protein H6S33_013175 [Morchella sextelata]KAH0609689.1 hypothetical protein H6S33_013175 [Morchella sextelata]
MAAGMFHHALQVPYSDSYNLFFKEQLPYGGYCNIPPSPIGAVRRFLRRFYSSSCRMMATAMPRLTPQVPYGDPYDVFFKEQLPYGGYYVLSHMQ